MADDSIPGQRRVSGHQTPGQFDKGSILVLHIGRVVRAFQFDADTKIVAVFTTVKTGNTRMPGALQKRYKLGNGAQPVNQYVSRDFQPGNFTEIRMLISIKLTAKKTLDIAATIAARRQADVMDYQQGDLRAWWARATMTRLTPPPNPQPTIFANRNGSVQARKPPELANRPGRINRRVARLCSRTARDRLFSKR